MARIDKIKNSLNHWGLLKTLHSGLMRFLCPWLTLCRIHVRPLQATAVEDELPDGVSIRRATRNDLLLAVEEMPNELSLDFINDALDRGDFCAGAFDGPHMVSFVWRSFSTAPHLDGLWVAFEKPYRYGYKAYTRPEYRGRHLIKSVTEYTDKLCIERGFTRGIGFVKTDNFASLAAEKKHKGYKGVGFAGYVKVFGKVYPFRSPGAKKSTFQFYRRIDGTDKLTRFR